MAPSPSGGKTANLQAVIDALAAHGVELGCQFDQADAEAAAAVMRSSGKFTA